MTETPPGTPDITEPLSQTPGVPAAPPTWAGEMPKPAPTAGGLAIASLVLGISGVSIAVVGFLCLMSPIGALLGAVAVALGWVSLAKRKPGKGMAWTGIVTGAFAVIAGVGFFLLLAPAIVTGMKSGTGAARSMVSMTNARQIGMGLLVYAADNQDSLPPAGPGWESLLSQHVSAKQFTSPNANGVTPSYIYVGSGRLSAVGAADVLLYENPAIVAEEYAVLYADGHVELKTSEELAAIVAKLGADKPKTGTGMEGK